jgi:hypothetical protein
LARKHIMKQPMALEMHVAATRDCFTARCSTRTHTQGQPHRHTHHARTD